MAPELREAEYSQPVQLNVFCGTWNVNNKILADVGLDEWLFPGGQPQIDIFAIGFQEIVELNPVNVTIDGSKSQNRSGYWRDRINESLASHGKKYTLIISRNLVGILFFIFVEESLLCHITEARVTTAAVGVMGVMGNKGGVSVSLRVYGTPVCFVCAHLAAKRNNVAGKHQNASIKINKMSYVLYIN